MTKTAAPASFELNVRVTNARGAWVELHAVNAPYTPTSYYAYAYAPDFTGGLERTTLGPRSSRAAIERGMRTWLRER